MRGPWVGVTKVKRAPGGLGGNAGRTGRKQAAPRAWSAHETPRPPRQSLARESWLRPTLPQPQFPCL